MTNLVQYKYDTFDIQVSYGVNVLGNKLDLPRVLWSGVAHEKKMFGP